MSEDVCKEVEVRKFVGAVAVGADHDQVVADDQDGIAAAVLCPSSSPRNTEYR